MLHGVALAERIAARITEAGAAERTFVVQMPGWASRTPSAALGIAVVRGAAWHVVAAVEWWEVIVAPPPPLARFARRWRWSTTKGPDAEAIGRDLAELASRWWMEAPEAVGALDVAGAITQAATASLGEARGAFGNVVHGEPGRDGAEVTARVGIGRQGSSPRWPELVDVSAEGGAILARVTTADGARERIAIADVATLARTLAELVATLRHTDDACAAWIDRLRALPVRTLQSRVPPPVAGATWSATEPFDIGLSRPPVVVLRTAAPAGGTVDVLLSAHAAGARVEVGGEAVDAPDGAALEASLPAIARAVERESRILRAQRLTPGARYRVKRDFGGARAGDELVFQQVTEVKPSGADVWFFAGPEQRSVTLGSDEAGDVAVLDALADHLEQIA